MEKIICIERVEEFPERIIVMPAWASDTRMPVHYIRERTCHTIPYNSQAKEYADAWKISAVCSECGWTLETKKGDEVRMHDPYCSGCGARVVS